jgi:hypothetical protein
LLTKQIVVAKTPSAESARYRSWAGLPTVAD